MKIYDTKGGNLYRYSVSILFYFSLVIVPHAIATVPSGDPPKIIVLEFHGLKKDIIESNLNRLPNFKELIQGGSDPRSYVHLPKVFTTLPAASVPACTAMYTGRFPQKTGVVSTIWFDRRATETYTMISYLQQRINNKLAQNNVKTIFDYVGDAGKRSMSAMLMIDKGTDQSIKSGMFFWGNASTVGFVKRGHWFPDPWYMDYKTISGFLTGHVFAYADSLSGILETQGNLPDLMVVQLLGTDIYSHYPDPDLVAQQASMAEIQTHYAIHVLDPLVGRVLRFLKKKRCFDRTIFFLVSQQGALKIQKHIPDSIVSDILKAHYTLPGALTSNQSADAVVMLGACTKEIYLKNRQTDHWLDPPRLVADVKPAVDLILENSVIQDSLNEMVIRQYPQERHEGLVEKELWWGFRWKDYCKSPKRNTDFFTALSPLNETLRSFQLADYLEKGLSHQYTRDTAPDIKLINKKGFYFERDFKKYGHHGSYYPEDTIISFWIAGPGLSHIIPGQHTLTQAASTLDLIPMVAALLKIEIPKDLDGDNALAGLLEN
jgi:predicted AlkP superfamily pyrophosphatase or phosphodiesterase